METKKQARVRFAESDTGDLTAGHETSNKPYAPLPALTIPIPGAPGGASGHRPSHLSPSSRALTSPVRKPTPTVTFDVSTDRDYLPLLHQTKMVYDQLLCDKQSKLLTEVYKVKQEYDSKCRQLDSVNKEQALEFGVRAQAHLYDLQTQADSELEALHKDYQQKMDKMTNSMDERWRKENPDKAVQYKLYLHK